MSKEKTLMIIIPSDEIEDTLKNGMDSGIERGLVVRSEIGKKLYEEFNNIKQFGYFPVGVILEDGHNLEFLFQRHPKQLNKNKMVELKMDKEKKLKL
jgi:hypothetical protein